MKYRQFAYSALRHLCALALAAGLAHPLPSAAALLTLATAPLATSTTSTVLPNLMFMLDDSGSMDWDYMPDDAKNFSGKYGFNSSHCNGVYYNPNITYNPPVYSNGTSYPNSSFTSALRDGYNSSSGADDLDTNFPGGSGSGSSGAANYTGPAFYYGYSGTQTTSTQMTIHNTNSAYYKECNSAIGATNAWDGTNPVNTVFHKTRLSTVLSTTISVSNPPGSYATITISSTNGGRVDSILVNGVDQILGGKSTSPWPSTSTSSVANNIAAKINSCTNSTRNTLCTVTGYSATVSGSVISVFGPAAGGSTLTLHVSNGSVSYTTTAFPLPAATAVSSITVNGTQLLPVSTASTTNANTLAGYIASGISASGFTATVSNNTVVVTYTGAFPTQVATYTPVITTVSASGGLIVTTDEFPENTPAKLQNFANWYSYYSNRMLMMKTGVGQAFSPLSNQFRVGYMTMNNNNWNGSVGSTTADFVDIAPFAGGCTVGSGTCQKDKWYSKLYAANPGNSTPLREVLSKVGRLYAHKFGSYTLYTSTITLGGSGATSVDSIKVGGVELLTGTSAASTSKSTEARNIVANFIDPPESDYTASANGNVITIYGPNSAVGSVPVVTDSGGGMTFSPTTFAPTTYTANLNGVTPADPIQYSCQQNFIILSTDGYWNGNAGYKVDGSTSVGNQDGSAPRPMYDGATGTTTVTTSYTRNYDTLSSCSGGNILRITPQSRTCTTTIISGVAQPENCPNWTNGTTYTYGSCSSATVLPSPNPSSPQIVSQTTASGTTGGTSNTLADVAMYYYQSDLRTALLNNCDGAMGTVAATGINVCDNNVFKTGSDTNTAQHMATFTLGLGASGSMIYSPSYLTDNNGDYYSVLKGITAHPTATPPVCAWQADGTTCNWPIPASGSLTNIDDLWHAAVDGGGKYFSATDPSSLASGLSGALAAIASRKGAASAAATSTLNPVAGNNYAYVASYTTVKWQGNLEARTIDTTTGVISQNATWCVENIVAGTCPAPGNILPDPNGNGYNCVITNTTQAACSAPSTFDSSTSQCSFPMATSCAGTMPGKVAANSDTRTIYTTDGTSLVPFLYANLTPAQQADFNFPYIGGLSQWPLLMPPQQTAAQGANLVNYLRGQTGYEDRAVNFISAADDRRVFRYRDATLGDALESQPAYIGKPVFSYPDKGYSDYATAEANRVGTVYIGTNDGMLHAFSALAEGSVAAGTERWAYVPSMVVPNMWKLADKDYANKHTNFVNGSPIISDVCTANCLATDSGAAVWRTILVGGLNAGGRGYYALDITDPLAPTLLWEFTTADDGDLGYSYGNPIITARSDGTWVVLLTSGYNNTGHGYLYVLRAGTGEVLDKLDTAVGTPTTPSGLAKITAWNDTPGSNRATYVYGGDLLGNLWRFDINTGGTPFLLANLQDPSGNPQPITTPPVLGKIGGKRVVFIGTGKYLETTDLSNTQVQTEYAIKDDDATVSLINPAGSPRSSATLVQQTITDNGDGTRTASSNPVDFSTDLGWYVDFPDSGERSNIESRLVQGTLIVATIVPSNTVCSPGGYGWLNFFNYQTGGSVDAGGIVSVRYGNTIVGFNVLFINGQPVTEVSTSSGDNTTDTNVQFQGSSAGFAGKRVLWRELNQ
jgi:Tfp pilus tip-associated adhesin PilY1